MAIIPPNPIRPLLKPTGPIVLEIQPIGHKEARAENDRLLAAAKKTGKLITPREQLAREEQAKKALKDAFKFPIQKCNICGWPKDKNHECKEPYGI